MQFLVSPLVSGDVPYVLCTSRRQPRLGTQHLFLFPEMTSLTKALMNKTYFPEGVIFILKEKRFIAYAQQTTYRPVLGTFPPDFLVTTEHCHRKAIQAEISAFPALCDATHLLTMVNTLDGVCHTVLWPCSQRNLPLSYLFSSQRCPSAYGNLGEERRTSE